MFNGAKAVKPGVVKRFRESHHMMARLFAQGLRPGEVARQMGMSNSRVSVLSGDPAFRQLVADYRADVDDAWREGTSQYYQNIEYVRNWAGRKMVEYAEECDETGEMPAPRVLQAMHDSAADRTGFAKRTVAINVNVDFASAVEKSRKRSAAVMVKPAIDVPALPAPTFRRRV